MTKNLKKNLKNKNDKKSEKKTCFEMSSLTYLCTVQPYCIDG